MSEDTKEKLIQAAGPLFSQLGYDGASVRAICKAAGLSQVAINYHYGNKENLYKNCVSAAISSGPADDFYNEIPKFLDPKVPAKTRLKMLLETSMECCYAQDRRWQDLLILRELLHPSPTCEPILKEAFEKENLVIQGILKELLPKDTCHETLVKFQMSIFGQAYMYSLCQATLPWMVSDEGLETEFSKTKVAEFIFDFSIAAIDAYCQKPFGS